jgi:hypothetical protein
MNKPLVFAISSACVAAALAVAPTAQAKSYAFYYGDTAAVCFSGQVENKPHAECEVADPTFTAPKPPTTCQGVWGNRIGMVQGAAPTFECHTDSLAALGPEYVVQGTPQIIGSISCIDDPAGMKCTDTSTGNFFILATNSYQLNPPGS